MKYSKAMTSTVRAWATNHKRSITVYKTDGQLLWVKGVLLGVTAKDGAKVVVSTLSGKATLFKAVDYAKACANLMISFHYSATDNERLHALWSLVERTHLDVKTNLFRFHHICKVAPTITKLNGPGVGWLGNCAPKKYAPKASTVVQYCPACHATDPIAGWKRPQWGAWVKKAPFKAPYDEKCFHCGKKLVTMSRQGAKLWWMAVSPSWGKNSPTDAKAVDEAIQKGL